ncbi:MAG: MIP/aquaporin family protein [Propionicimonas sp.]|nr:MIP/aquaporin family protein [Propionicimonas sp.]MEA4944463.1 MIP/aquaporin family protein [Propionicimonas sp.]MEA5118845.1 MIP/aquaporin family protein [Propionicimonas sp.]
MTLGTIFLAETVGTMLLLLLGGGVVANNILNGTKGKGTGFLMVNWGWGLAVFTGVVAAWKSGGHLNPAVTIGLAVNKLLTAAPGKPAEFVPGIPVDAASISVYILAQMLGAFLGAVLVWLAYKKQFDADQPEGFKLGVFSTGPEIRSYAWNVVTEAIGTFVLVFFVIALGYFAGDIGWLAALPVALLIVGIGASLGGPTGYAINPARDLGPRIAHALLPIPNKGSSDWSYSWVPVVGPIIGGVVAGLLGPVLLPLLGA